jgi:hypothetical protein
VLWYSSGATNSTNAGNIGVQSGTVLLWGVQLEIGSVATPLEKPDPQQDLAKCQRFYEVGSRIYFSGNVVSGWPYYVTARFQVTKRAVPTMTLGDIGTNSAFPATAPIVQDISVDSITANKTSNATNSSAYFVWNFTASADL